ncbi:hypothetical protein NGRA_1975 [Nosema granulosis]|uniref:Uncharacterized protein n=1 Tax=Nosema granulosis TaxID=83296 RepID=A0A9P6KY49_9MICR|nr:hypothetical protein NGRA_1975 [Nosema granulosis]
MDICRVLISIFLFRSVIASDVNQKSIGFYFFPVKIYNVKHSYKKADFSILIFNTPKVIERRRFSIENIEIVNDEGILIPQKELDKYLISNLPFRLAMSNGERVFVSDLVLIVNKRVKVLEMTKHIELFTYAWYLIKKCNNKKHDITQCDTEIVENDIKNIIYFGFGGLGLVQTSLQRNDSESLSRTFFIFLLSIADYTFLEVENKHRIIMIFKNFLDRLNGFEINNEGWIRHIETITKLLSTLERNTIFFEPILKLIPLISNRILTFEEICIFYNTSLPSELFHDVTVY